MALDPLHARVHEDHASLDRIFTSLQATLDAMAAQDVPDTESDLLQDAREDLSFALEEMLEHFGIEEEAIFAHLEEALPDLAPRLQALAEAHEVLCRKTSDLRKLVGAAESGAAPFDLARAQRLVRETTRLLAYHNQQEMAVFHEAMERLNDEDRRTLMDNLRNH